MAKPTAPKRRLKPTDRRGIVLVAVLIVVVLMSLASYQYVDLMTAEYKATENAVRHTQARVLAESGINYTAALLADPLKMEGWLNYNPYNNPQYFEDQDGSPDSEPRKNGRFSILSPQDDPMSGEGPRFGVTDEMGKINVNALIRLDKTGKMLYDLLMKLPNMTSDIAAAIVDWLDEDDTILSTNDGGQGGAESAYYLGLSPPYRAKNGPIDSLEELLLVRGVTPQLLFGNDTNRNGVQDADEASSDGTFDRGWSQYLTIYGRETNKAADGTDRLNVNDTDMTTLYGNLLTGVGSDMANFILLYRLYGAATTTSTTTATVSTSGGTTTATITAGGSSSSSQPTIGNLSTVNSSTLNLTKAKSNVQIKSLFDLVDAAVDVPNTDPKKPATRYMSPLKSSGAQNELLPMLFDKCKINADTEIQGRINVNTAPEAVLRTLPGLSDTDITNILQTRPSFTATDSPDDKFKSPAWLLTDAKIKVATLKTLEKYVTTVTQVYRFQVIGYFEGGGPFVRMEAVVDVNNGNPRVLYQRDISELGRGFDLQKQQQ